MKRSKRNVQVQHSKSIKILEISENKIVSQKKCNNVLSMREELNEFRKTGLFCDFTIILPDKSSYAVHKIVVAAGCPYFKSLFNFENPNKISETIPREISGKIFEKILEFIYTGETEIDLKDALVLHENAIYFMLNTLKDNVRENHLINNIQMDTCLIYWRGAVLDKILKEKCEEFIAQNSKEFFGKYLYELTYEELSEILSLETLNCPEEGLYLFLINWVKSDYENRKNIFNDLLNNLRFFSLSDNAKVNVSVECSEIRDSLQVLVKHFKKNLANEQLINFTDKSLAPRIGFSTQQLFGVSTSQIINLDNNLNFKNLLDNKETVGFKINNFAKNYLLISGGENSKICKYYCPIRNTMKTFPELLKARSNHGIVTMNNIICAAGGCSTGRTTEQFDLCSGIWINGPDLNSARRNHDLTSYNNCIYAFGGGSNIIERLDLRENKWISLNYSNNCDISGLTRTLTIDNSIYCLSANTINIFDIRQEKWISNNPISTSSGQLRLINFEISYFNKNINMVSYGHQTNYNYGSTYYFYKYDINNKVWSLQNNCNLGTIYSLAVLYR